MLVCLQGILLLVARGHPYRYLCADTSYLPKNFRCRVIASEGTIGGIVSFVLFVYALAELQRQPRHDDGVGRSREDFGLRKQDPQHPDLVGVGSGFPGHRVTDDYFSRVEGELPHMSETLSFGAER